MTSRRVRVVKLGGSLLDWPQWVDQFRRWLVVQPQSVNLLVIGGGPIVDVLRTLDRVHPMSSEAAHWLAVRAMGITAGVAAELVDEATLVRSREELQLSMSDAPQILDVERFLHADRLTSDALPRDWDVTSDSIAARLADVLEARELVLLKSALPEEGPLTLESAAQRGIVDAYFPQAARGIRVRFVNLRDARFAEIALDNERARS